MNYVLIIISTLVTVTLIAQLLGYATSLKAKKVETRKTRR